MNLFRSSFTGRFITRREAEADPSETTRETAGQPFPVAHRELLNAAMTCANTVGVREAIRRLRA